MPKLVQKNDKAETRTVSLPKSLWEAIEARAAEMKSNRSEFLKALVNDELSGKHAQPNALSPTVLADLARVLGGEMLARDLEKTLQGVDQPTELYRLLRSISPSASKEITRAIGDVAAKLQVGSALSTNEHPVGEAIKSVGEAWKNTPKPGDAPRDSSRPKAASPSKLQPPPALPKSG